jgi:hypothetical protein
MRVDRFRNHQTEDTIVICLSVPQARQLLNDYIAPVADRENGEQPSIDYLAGQLRNLTADAPEPIIDDEPARI